MSTKKAADPFGKVESAARRFFHLREKRDAALKAVHASLNQIEAMVDPDVDTELDATEEFGEKVDAFVELDKRLCAAHASFLTESQIVLSTLVEARMARA